jgi:NAD(P)-dependent dehydrogenase (short-subunit alcohol dehydrogenase family)
MFKDKPMIEAVAKRSLVTGAGAGVGRAVALALARSGARVCLVDIDETANRAVAQEIEAEGGAALAIAASVADPDQVARVFSALDEAWGGIDLLVNNAGITANRPSLEISVETWLRTIDINLNGVFYFAQQAGRRMAAQGGGAIVNLASIYGQVAAPNRAAYCASKAGVVHLTRALAIEWAAHGIRVNAVAPGYVDTLGTAELVAQGRIDLPSLERRTPLGRLATPDEIAGAILYLASPEASYITGQVLGVDGGWTAYGYI